jgi:hypothetical protein
MDHVKSTFCETVGPSVQLLHLHFARRSMLSPLNSLEGAYVIRGNLARRIVAIDWEGRVQVLPTR